VSRRLSESGPARVRGSVRVIFEIDIAKLIMIMTLESIMMMMIGGPDPGRHGGMSQAGAWVGVVSGRLRGTGREPVM
jgi:hypothetical protein